ncbi:hypothetical protein LPJ64_001225 [Coemansia asiatica]|uniref:SS18 N-terminal domain-containing protein n=1 Tax=Coemansia asiatica TaxID=1052880 RepID=A0A9W8CM43_9FUNG|nr:hypothetical protein LPJ64_001225 [Coemansia asiatica]
MSNPQPSDVEHESDIDVILDDDSVSETCDPEPTQAADISSQPTTNPESTVDTKATASSATSNSKKQVQDEEPSNPYLPNLKTSIIQMVLNINAELIKLCQEYQNNSLMDDPQLAMYQMRLQSNLAYLASIADHYLDPTRAMPDFRPLPRPNLPRCQGTSIGAKLQHAREIYTAYVSAWSEQQMQLSRKAKTRLRDEEKSMFSNLDRDGLHQKFEQVLKMNRVTFDKSADEPVNPDTFRPFPPFRVPDDIQLPPGLQKWSFDNNTAVPEAN